jgi:hypothetical protein
MADGTEWERFFDENPKPHQFKEDVQKIHDFCKAAARKLDHVVLVTVIQTLYGLEHQRNIISLLNSLVEPQFL